MTIKDIKAKYNFGGNGKFYRILDENNIPRSGDRGKSFRGKKHLPETIEKMKASHVELWDKMPVRDRHIGGSRVFTPDQYQEVVDKYLSGTARYKLAEEYGCDSWAITNILNITGTVIRPDMRHPTEEKRRLENTPRTP